VQLNILFGGIVCTQFILAQPEIYNDLNTFYLAIKSSAKNADKEIYKDLKKFYLAIESSVNNAKRGIEC